MPHTWPHLRDSPTHMNITLHIHVTWMIMTHDDTMQLQMQVRFYNDALALTFRINNIILCVSSYSWDPLSESEESNCYMSHMTHLPLPIVSLNVPMHADICMYCLWSQLQVHEIFLTDKIQHNNTHRHYYIGQYCRCNKKICVECTCMHSLTSYTTVCFQYMFNAKPQCTVSS